MRPEVWDAMSTCVDDAFGNPSGVHGVSRAAKNALEDAREEIATVIGCAPMEIVFTSGGTESDNLAIKGAALSSAPGQGLVTTAIEHDAVLEAGDFLKRMGLPVAIVGVDASGRADPEEIADAVSDDTAVVSVMAVNNETGSIQDIGAVVAGVKKANRQTIVHTDAVQAFGSEEIDVRALGVDLATITGHKFGGPKGVGILYVREGTVLEPIIHGGGQELGRRSGTNDVLSAVGLAAAVRLAAADRGRFRTVVGPIRDQMVVRLAEGFDGLVVNTPEEHRSVHHLNVRFPGVRNETLLMLLDQRGVAASAGSACQSGAATVSHVLEAMGLTPDEARESVRFSFGWTSTVDEVSRAADIVVEQANRLRGGT